VKSATSPNPAKVSQNIFFRMSRAYFELRAIPSAVPNRYLRPYKELFVSQSDAQKYLRMVYSHSMRTNIDINESLVRKARKLTRLKTKRQIVDKALELLVRSETRKGILRYYGSGIWKGDRKAMRRNRV